MGSPALEQDLLALEKQFWQAMKDKDAPAAARLTDDPVIVTGPQGVGRIDKKAFARMMETSTWQLERFEISKAEVRMLSDDVAIVAYKVHQELIVEGERLTLEAADSSTWVRRDGRWLCAMHTEALAGDPFGRDRRREPEQDERDESDEASEQSFPASDPPSSTAFHAGGPHRPG